MTELYLVRHGQARVREWRPYGPDPGLTAVGRAQAAQRGAWLAGRGPFAALYCSPLRRARETAGIMAASAGRPPLVVPALAEWEPPHYLSPLRGLLNQALRQVHAGHTSSPLARRTLQDQWVVMRALRARLPAWRRFVRRVGRATATLAARHPAERLLLVSHGGTIRATLTYFGVAPLSLYRYDTLGFCSVSVLHLAPGGASALLTVFDDCRDIVASRS
jgi:broad specificity phosphatase PhoE